jgi:hypothetical protein
MALPVIDPATPSAEQQAAPEPIAQVVTKLQDVVGQALAAHIAGVAEPEAVGRWASGASAPPDHVVGHLRTAWDIAQLLLEVETPAVVRAWFGGRNLMLGGRPPALLVRSDPDAVRRAARAFRAYG